MGGVTADQDSSQSASFASPSPVQAPWQAAQEQVRKEDLSAISPAYYAVGQPLVYWQLGQVDLSANPYFYPSGSDSDKDC